MSQLNNKNWQVNNLSMTCKFLKTDFKHIPPAGFQAPDELGISGGFGALHFSGSGMLLQG